MYKWDAEDYQKHSSTQQKWARELIKKLELKGSEFIIDIGCGDGKITAEIASILNTGCVLGIDSSKDMIELAKKTFAQEKNLNFRLLDVHNLDYNEEFDIVFSNAALHWVHDQLPVLKKVYSSLKPSGKILFQMGGKGNARDFFLTIDELINDVHWKKYFLEFDFEYGMFGDEEYERWLREAGFSINRVELIPKTMTKTEEDFKSWIRTTWLPYTERVPSKLRSKFIDELVRRYIEINPEDDEGRINLNMIRLEVEATK
ncbi:MAG: class I SAM-dependent methyltransferase [Methanobacterium sp.]